MRDPISVGAILIVNTLIKAISVLANRAPRTPPEVEENQQNNEQDKIRGKPIQDEEDMPDFQEIFELGEDLVLGIEYLEFSPDEKAVVRIVGSESYSKQYRKKVYTTERGDKFINVDKNRFYLRKARVQS